jgi:hypothetical protein
MNAKKLKEEIKLLERRVELLEQYIDLHEKCDELRRQADEYNKKLPTFPIYPIYPTYPQPVYPWERVVYSGGTTTIPCETITAHNGPATSDTVIVKEGDQVSYTN